MLASNAAPVAKTHEEMSILSLEKPHQVRKPDQSGSNHANHGQVLSASEKPDPVRLPSAGNLNSVYSPPEKSEPILPSAHTTEADREITIADRLDDIHVRKIVETFQKSPKPSPDIVKPSPDIIKPSPDPVKPSLDLVKPPSDHIKQPLGSVKADAKETIDVEKGAKCPEKPVRRSREKSVERPLTSAVADSNRNVMSIVSRLNAMSM